MIQQSDTSLPTSLINRLLFETIKIEDGQINNINWHNRRCNRSRAKLFNATTPLELENFINPPQKGLYRCRIIYGEEIDSIEYIPYTPKSFYQFNIIESQIEYSYKYSNREELKQLKNGYDEIIIEKDGLLTDTSIANIAFYDGKEWVTPKTPLLKGTTRERLLNSNFLREIYIKADELQKFSHFALMNAMIGFQIQKNFNIN